MLFDQISHRSQRLGSVEIPDTNRYLKTYSSVLYSVIFSEIQANDRAFRLDKSNIQITL